MAEILNRHRHNPRGAKPVLDGSGQKPKKRPSGSAPTLAVGTGAAGAQQNCRLTASEKRLKPRTDRGGVDSFCAGWPQSVGWASDDQARRTDPPHDARQHAPERRMLPSVMGRI